MTDYGVARLKELTEDQKGLDAIFMAAKIDEVIVVLSDLAASLREGEFHLKPWLMSRKRTRTATGVYNPRHTRGTIESRSSRRWLRINTSSGTCCGQLRC